MYKERNDDSLRLGSSRKYIHPPPMDNINWVPKNFRISKKDRSILCRIPDPADSKSWGIPEFKKIFNGFAGIPIKTHKILGKFMEFQSGSPSIYYRISNVVHGGVWIFFGIAHLILHIVAFIYCFIAVLHTDILQAKIEIHGSSYPGSEQMGPEQIIVPLTLSVRRGGGDDHPNGFSNITLLRKNQN